MPDRKLAIHGQPENTFINHFKRIFWYSFTDGSSLLAGNKSRLPQST